MNCLYQSKRISDLKEKMLSSKRYASIEQARIITRVYQENEDVSIPKKRALSLKAALEELEISVEDEELIVGNRTKGVRYGVVFPESGCSWVNQEFETLPTRPQDQFLVKEEDIKELKEIIDYAKAPFIVKGIMSVEGAQKAINAGAQGIVVSNHGGRVLDGTPATAAVLEEIADKFKGQVKIFVDGGIRSGLDVFKALALGADAVIIARPFVNMIYGAGKEGVEAYVQQLGQELENVMMMTGVSSLKEVSKKNIYK